MSDKPMFDILWAPWRLAYVQDAAKAAGRGGAGECLFCTAPQLRDEDSLIVYRGRLAYVILNKYPYNTGHLMIAPYRHVPSFEELTREEALEVFELLGLSLRALRRAFEPHGFNVGANIGEAAGAGVPGHVHIHVVPRWIGDSNFMLVVGRTKVLPQLLSDTWAILRKQFSELGGGSGLE
ncbi:MAG: HIT domain-containing protein [Acidilobaceae archaeon]